jgi:quercetin dioxygenase-like cupin family protein
MSAFVKASDIREDTFDWGTIGWRCGPASTGAKTLVVMDVTISPGQRHDFHKHPEQDEVIVVRSGRLKQYLEQESELLGPGDSVFVPADVVHASIAVGDEPAVLQVVIAPALGEDTGYELVDMSTVEPYASLRD